MSEAYSMVSVKKKSDQAGRSSGKKMYIVLFRWEDVAKFEKDEKGIHSFVVKTKENEFYESEINRIIANGF